MTKSEFCLQPNSSQKAWPDSESVPSADQEAESQRIIMLQRPSSSVYSKLLRIFQSAQPIFSSNYTHGIAESFAIQPYREKLCLLQ